MNDDRASLMKKLENSNRELQELAFSLGERIKEMDLLVRLSELMQKPDMTLEVFLQETVNLIPPAFMYPDSVASRIRFRNLCFATKKFHESSWVLTENIIIGDASVGSVEVYYRDTTRVTEGWPFLKEEEGLIITLSRFLENIIEKIETDVVLKMSQQKFHQYIKNAPDGIFITDATGHYIEVNPAACELLGYSEDELLSMSIPDIVPPEAKEENLEGVKNLFEHGRDKRETILQRKDGTRVHVDLDAVSLPDGHYMGFCKDISERKIKEKEVLELLSFHRTLLDTIPAPVYYKDKERKYLGINHHFTEFFGIEEKDMIGKTAFELFPCEHAEIYHRMDDMLYRNGGVQEYESQLMDSRGSLHDVLFYKAVFYNAEGKEGGIIGLIMDITDKKRAEYIQELYYKANQSVDQPIIITDNDGDIVIVNDAFSKMYGYSKDEAVGNNPRILNPGKPAYMNLGYYEDEYDELFGSLWTDIKNPAVGTWEGIVINRKKDGTLIWVKLIINAVYRSDGTLQNFIALPIDISSSVQSEKLTKIQLYQTIASLAELRDNETGNHMRRVGILAKLLARTKNMPDKFCDDIEVFAPMHDIGKVGIVDSILLAERVLTDEEMSIMKTHAEMGYNIVKGIKELEMVAEITLRHHEKYDGSGYPGGLKGEEIPLSARITAIVDAYDALRSRRPYKEEWTHEEAKQYILTSAAKHFDPELVSIFSEIEERFDAVYNELKD